MQTRFKKILLSLAVTGVLVGGSAAIANAATSKSAGTTTTKTAPSTTTKPSTMPPAHANGSGNCPNM